MFIGDIWIVIFGITCSIIVQDEVTFLYMLLTSPWFYDLPHYKGKGVVERHAGAGSFGRRLLVNCCRPFTMTYTEPMILVFSFYLTIIYIVHFTFLNGFPYIFSVAYGISDSLTSLIWAALLAGDFIAVALIPIVYGWTKKVRLFDGKVTHSKALWLCNCK